MTSGTNAETPEASRTAKRGTGSPELRQELLQALEAQFAFQRVADAPWPIIERFELGGLWSSSAALAVARLARGRGRLVVLLPDPESAEGFALDLAALAPGLDVALLPVEEEGLAEGPEMRANRSERLVALAALGAVGDGVLLVSGASLLESLPAAPTEELKAVRGEQLDRDAFIKKLVGSGFDRVALVAAPGEISVRGDIIDVYPWASSSPVRIEMLDDEVEELRRFEVDSQISVELLPEVRLPLAGASQETRRLHEMITPATPVLVVDPPRLKDRLAEAAFLHDIAPKTVEVVMRRMREHPGGELFALDLGRPELDLSIRSSGEARSAEEAVGQWSSEGRAILLLCDTQAEADRLGDVLVAADLPPGPRLHVEPGRLTAGFSFPDGGPVVVHHHELIGRRGTRRTRPRRVVVSRAVESAAELHPGDYVVHLTHGVARYGGMQRLTRDQGEEDFLALEFADDTTLYVPASRIDLVERFIGGGSGGSGAGPKLDKIGGKSWRRKKARVNRAVADLASELLEVQTARKARKGFAFPPDDPLQGRFEAAFPYEDTPDQHTSWTQIRGDMERDQPTDRLLIGDVGFGKTEVAVRAAYKAVLAGKQVAVLVPTTILAEQHFDTFSHRMADEPVRVEALSRFRTGKHIKAVLKDLASGRVDVLIGTHRLLSADVKFADLGLIIVDEEQRFGVAHKERLKRLKSTVDVLTLSATPIPRTLHMAMSGLRDISSIKTPPPGRRAVITKVGYDDDAVLRDAVRHEIGRGGQVFVLHNRVQSIEIMAGRVSRLAPTARLAVAHGQMDSKRLRGIVEEFADGKIDVLVCTTIIESGIDIPRANTIVVTDAHRFGLADLHQLRGRVGREQRQAYAHFLVPRDKPIPRDAQRRLKAIEEYSSLGAGLTIALRDLELRGAGNLLGAEQSGHILAVGYDMYCRLLQAAVARAKGRRVEEEPGEIEVELGLAAFLPAEYVPDETVRMSILRRLASSGAKRLDAIEKELVDRFGKLPDPAQELIDLFRLRRRVRLCGLTSALADGLGGILLTIGDARLFEERAPFAHRDLIPVSLGRFRHEWPKAVQTAAQRLRYLLDRFASSARAKSLA